MFSVVNIVIGLSRVRTGPAGRTRGGFHDLTSRVRSSQVVFETISHGSSGREFYESYGSDRIRHGSGLGPRVGRGRVFIFSRVESGRARWCSKQNLTGPRVRRFAYPTGRIRIPVTVASGRVRWCSKQCLTGPRVRRFANPTGRIGSPRGSRPVESGGVQNSISRDHGSGGLRVVRVGYYIT